MKGQLGVVAAGHEHTAEAAVTMLRGGGNAFDAVLAAMCASCVAEPVLASLGGGGFLLAKPADGEPLIYDFFAHTPRRRPSATALDFHPIVADFGGTVQEFHIGLGSIATPGIVKGLFKVQERLCRLPLHAIVEPACKLARAGIRVNRFQYYISTILEPILRASPAAMALHRTDPASSRLAAEGECVANPALADCLEALVREGDALFYRGEMGQRLVGDSRQHGGCLREDDLANYRMETRRPLHLPYHHAHLATNPPPSLGGILIGYTLSLLQATHLERVPWGSGQHRRLLATAMRLTQKMRRESSIHQASELLSSPDELLERLTREHRHILDRHARFSRGTTQISVCDRAGNLASMTLSNGEGSGYVIPGTGIMMNNMLGEEDINPHGFNRWPPDRRIASMMAPTLVSLEDGTFIATGSGGSNRIRSALLQVISNLVDYRMTLQQAVAAPRVHYESGQLNMEPPAGRDSLDTLAAEFPYCKLWDEKNLFFGGAHSVRFGPGAALSGVGDPRRGGATGLAVRRGPEKPE